MNIVVVESPAKAKTINAYLGRGYEVLASFGHVRDLPPKDGSVDPDADFHMIWEIDPKAQKRLNGIATAVKGADKLILATDPDREGEAISWHVLEALKQKRVIKNQRIERVVFNAITKQAVTEAMKHPRDIDRALVDAYLARRALDYLVGFTLSPVLWRKLPGREIGRPGAIGGAAAGLRPRARDREIRRAGILVAGGDARDASRRRVRGAAGRRRRRQDPAPRHRHRRGGGGIQAGAGDGGLHGQIGRSQARAAQSRIPPFTTSTLQQEASRKLGFAPAHTMRIAQRLYEGVEIDGETIGLITYMRTDGVQIAEEAIARHPQPDRLASTGGNTCPDAPRRYQVKAKNAQEAHEAIRPTDVALRPRDIGRRLDADQAKLYELIWRARSGEPDGIRRTRTHHGRYRGEASPRASSNCAPPAR